MCFEPPPTPKTTTKQNKKHNTPNTTPTITKQKQKLHTHTHTPKTTKTTSPPPPPPPTTTTTTMVLSLFEICLSVYNCIYFIYLVNPKVFSNKMIRVSKHQTLSSRVVHMTINSPRRPSIYTYV